VIANRPRVAEDCIRACRSAFDFAHACSFAGHDPFDLLLVPGGDLLRRLSPNAARGVVQLGLRTGQRLRRAAGVPRHEEAKAIADFLAAAAALADDPEAPWARDAVPALVDRLERLAVTTPNGRGWGLSFPYASRFVSVAARTPNAYTTISVVTALVEAGGERPLALAHEGARFITRDLGLVDGWVRYWPGDDTRIVNVQALVAAGFAALPDPEAQAVGEAAAAAALSAQRPDGSFPYALGPRGDFVDAFHTGFVLEGLARAGAAPAAVASGFEYFEARLLDEQGFPLRSPGGQRADDGQNVAQAIQTLLACAGDSERAWRLWEAWASRPRHGSSLRWDVAPMALASARLARDARGL
jgi:hypothetical protein